MTDLAPLLRLRALRETRAAHAAAMATARLDAALADQAGTATAIARHDLNVAERETRLHDAMIARGFTMADLTDADIRARHATARRGGLAADHAKAALTTEAVRAEAETRKQELRRAILGHEKLRLAQRLLNPSVESADD